LASRVRWVAVMAMERTRGMRLMESVLVKWFHEF